MLAFGLPPGIDQVNCRWGTTCGTRQLEVIKNLSNRTPTVLLKHHHRPSKRTELEALGATVVPIVTGGLWECSFGFSNRVALVFFVDGMTTSLLREMSTVSTARSQVGRRGYDKTLQTTGLRDIVERLALTILSSETARLAMPWAIGANE